MTGQKEIDVPLRPPDFDVDVTPEQAAKAHWNLIICLDALERPDLDWRKLAPDLDLPPPRHTSEKSVETEKK